MKNQNITENIWSAVNGTEASKMIESKKPDIVLLNLQMPDMYGFDVIEKFQNTNIKFIIVTGFIDMEITQKAKELNVAGIINKPFTYECFSEKLNNALNKVLDKQVTECCKAIECKYLPKKNIWNSLFGKK